ncbi:MAG: YmdB family metallophosphoesterase, partial [Pseudomonadota bacterium]
MNFRWRDCSDRTVAYIDTEPRLLRPINYPPGTPGSGSIVLETKKGKVGVINVQGRT